MWIFGKKKSDEQPESKYRLVDELTEAFRLEPIHEIRKDRVTSSIYNVSITWKGKIITASIRVDSNFSQYISIDDKIFDDIPSKEWEPLFDIARQRVRDHQLENINKMQDDFDNWSEDSE